MKYVFLLITALSVSAHAAEHNLLIGLYTAHHDKGMYRDYRKEFWFHADQHEHFNQGGPKANKFIGYQYQQTNWSAGACTFENSFYERTTCVFGAIEYQVASNWTLMSGVNVTYGYRLGLITQERSASMSKAIIPITFVGVKYKFMNMSLAWQLVASNVSTVVLGIGF